MKYPIAITINAEGVVTVRVADVPGCVVTAPNLEEAMHRIEAAVIVRRQLLAQAGEALSVPKSVEDHKSAGTYGDGVEWTTVEVKETGGPSPRDFMRARRPELYSDSSSEHEPIVDKTYLAFALGQVTERKDEVPFEHFCRKLAEKEICPNLIPQTGPTGGGDSKVDSETYPVSERIAARWYIGEPERSSKERWAFAFSAKQDWKPKVKDDVRKIVKTGRDYSMVYFFTNQQVPDRQRGDIEDKLSAEWGLDVRIFDRNWIADKVLTNGHQGLFESTLQVHLEGATTRRLGPTDYERDISLTELDDRIANPDCYSGMQHELAEDCLETAILARGLEQPRNEVDGRFDRAERAARDGGNDRQLLRITYHRAWTAICWHEDYHEFNRLYGIAASLGLGKDNVWDLERLVILWKAGTAWRRNQAISYGSTDWDGHTVALRVALGDIGSNEAKPTSALMAQTLLAMMSMVDKGTGEALRSGLSEIAAILEHARHHLDYPFDSMARIVEELVNMVGGDGGLDEPLEKIIAIQAERGGEVQEGRMRLQRAFACVKAGRHVEAIRQAGMSQVPLGHGGDDEAFLKAIFTTAYAYEAMGLLWAARASYVFALHWVLREIETSGRVPSRLYVPLTRLIWVEIQLGRVPQALCWVELHGELLNETDLSESQIGRLSEEFVLMDAVLAIVVLKSEWPDLGRLDRAPGVFGELGLYSSKFAAMFLLGYEAAVASEAGLEDPEGFFSTLLCQPAARDLAEQADWGLRWPFTLAATLFGCRIDILVRDGLPSLLLGETILGFMESFLATSGWVTGLASSRMELSVEIIEREDAKDPFEFELVEDDVGEVRIVVSHGKRSMSQVDERYFNAMMELFAHVLSQLWIRISEADLESLFAEERAQDRGMMAAQLPVAFTSLLGESAKVETADWMRHESTSLALRRTKPWSRPECGWLETVESRNNQRMGLGQAGFGIDAVRHRDTKVLSVLNMPLWDAAGWKGIGYTYGHGDDIPEMHFSFENIEAGRKIIRGWIKKFGEADPEDTIGLTLITGIDRDNPHWYKLVVSHKDADVLESDERLVSIVSRFQKMTPADHRNLSQFLERYKRLGRYRIAALEHRPVGGVMQIPPPGLCMEKRSLKVVPAWKIGPDDFMRVALTDEDNPVIPPGEEDPPFHRV